MKIQEVIPKSTYTCQCCDNTFVSYGDLKIETNIWPVCSKKCEFKVIYKLLKMCELSDENLGIMAKNTKVYNVNQPFTRHNALFAICKYYSKIGLSNIKCLWTLDMDKKIRTKRCPHNMDKSNGHYPPIGGMSNVHMDQTSKNEFVHKSSEGGLQKWF